MTDQVRIFDTTLRDGEQAPGCTMTREEKLRVARQLARLEVDVIEAGFPAASPGDWEAVNLIAREIGEPEGPVICGLARADRRDIERCATAIAPAARRRIHTFLATSDVHLEYKLRMSRGEVIERVAEMVAFARTLCDDVEFSPEDAGRSDRAFLFQVLEAAIRAGAATLNIPDTVGYLMPDEYGALIGDIRDRVPGARDVTISVHCHDDLGVAVANSLAGVRAGARQVECTINGIGERAGNAALEEVVMAIDTRAHVFGVHTRIRTQELVPASRLVAACIATPVPPNKAVVGANAFAHEAGIHQHGVLNNKLTYEIMDAEAVGFDGMTLVLGKHSGRHALQRKLSALGYTLDEAQFRRIFERFKALADRKKRIAERDVEALVAEEQAPRRPMTLFEKLWSSHVVRPATDETPAMLYADLHLVHEVTSPQAFTALRERGLRVRRPDRTVATMDHSTPTTPRDAGGRIPVLDGEAAAQLRQLEVNCRDFDIRLFGLESERQGIVHVIGPELGLTQPGMTVVCGDSHTSTHGAFGTLAFGIGTSEVAHVLATQCLLQRKPNAMAVRVDGRLPAGVTAKDVILAVIARIGVGGGTGHAIEYTGTAIHALSMEERMTICNMSIEAGARAGMIAPDDTTFEYLAGRPYAPREEAWDRALQAWRTLSGDEGASYDREVALDASALEPMITYGTNPGMGIPISGATPDPAGVADPSSRAALERALRYMGLHPGQQILGAPVDVVFIGSCTNSRLSDLRLAAAVLEGRKVAHGIRVLVVPGSRGVKRQAEAEGLDRIFRDAGAEWREAGCSMCIAMNGDQLQPGQYAVSTSNRNFEGRQGAGGRTFLASPLTAAAAALTGRITDPRQVIT